MLGAACKETPVDIKDLLEDRVGVTMGTQGGYRMKWKLFSDVDLSYLVVYQGN